MSGPASAVASGLRARLAAEVRQSPAKAAALGLGLIVAVVVWGPKLAGGSATQGVAPGAVVSEGAEPDAGFFSRRDPARIRAEFIGISKRARSLRRLAERVPMGPVPRDPFAGPVLTEPRVVETPDEAPAVEPDQELALERQAAAELKLSGVIAFPSGRSMILDGKVLRVGDEVAGFTVVEIGDRSALLRGRLGDHEVSMEEKR